MIAVFIDSNSLFTKYDPDFSKVWAHGKLDLYAEMIESADLYEYVKIVVPRIVFDELHKQQLELYKAKIDELKKLVLPSWVLESGLDVSEYKDWISKEYASLVNLGRRGMVECEIPEIPSSCFESVIKRAIEKIPPFEGRDKYSDKGFKDALIWETILDYKQHHHDEKIIWITQDKRLKDSLLKKEYEELFNDELNVLSDLQDFEEALNQEMSKLNIDGKKSYTVNTAKELDQCLRSLIFNNMTSILNIGNFDNKSDTRYRVDDFVLINDEQKTIAESTLWIIRDDNEMQACNLAFWFYDHEDGVICDLFVNGVQLEIDYESSEFEGIDFEF